MTRFSFPPVTLGIDYGTKRIGLAISRASLVEPLEVIVVPQVPKGAYLNDEGYQFVLAILKDRISHFGVKRVVVGVSENEMAAASSDFAEKISKDCSISVIQSDETLSSQEVLKKLRKYRKRKPGEPIDHYAAAEILERFLEIE